MNTIKQGKIFWVFALILFLQCEGNSNVSIPGSIEARLVDKYEYATGILGNSIFQMKDYFVWGASVIQGEDGKFHMFFSCWESGEDKDKFSDSWVLESKIGYAVSETPAGPFLFEKILLEGRRFLGEASAWDAQSVHNPHIRFFENRYYLYYTGSRDPGEQPVGSSGEGVDMRNRVQQSQQVGYVAFDNFESLLKGDYFRCETPLLSPRTRVKPDQIVNGSPEGTIAKPDNIIVVNPSVVFDKQNSRYLLYFKGNLYEPNWKGAHGVAIGPSPTGPFEAQDKFMFDVRLEDGTIASSEDPFVWFNERDQRFKAVVKDFTGAISGEVKGLGLLESEDGIEWKPSENPLFMKRQLVLETGVTADVGHLERPQLLFDDQSSPIMLFAACSLENVGLKKDGSSFNVHIPIVYK